ncbi:tetracycline resistance protein tetM [Bacillus pseudomycoides]|nr:tetracycline resistance protein tetM [Bacillus pseudomycoides]PEI96909.1 tetracycline resistance protein tetM [Bacillus pseudomycoides]PEK23526.1 tetracycline resistance protein tetM [Bacillus pseudomycoides]PEM64362.1 tetracycline resistance protein tetM [Bacillus pseudomycoides]PEO22787.1 tetracycline resistance protein tetM [Bacillus pseudomycoides]
MRQFITKRNEEMNIKNEMRVLTHENNKYRDCGACRRWKDEFD